MEEASAENSSAPPMPRIVDVVSAENNSVDAMKLDRSIVQAGELAATAKANNRKGQ